MTSVSAAHVHCSKCIHSISGRKCVTESGLNDSDVPYDANILVVRCNFSLFCIRSFDHISISGLKADVLFEFSAAVVL